MLRGCNVACRDAERGFRNAECRGGSGPTVGEPRSDPPASVESPADAPPLSPIPHSEFRSPHCRAFGFVKGAAGPYPSEGEPGPATPQRTGEDAGRPSSAAMNLVFLDPIPWDYD